MIKYIFEIHNKYIEKKTLFDLFLGSLREGSRMLKAPCLGWLKAPLNLEIFSMSRMVKSPLTSRLVKSPSHLGRFKAPKKYHGEFLTE